MGRTLVPAGGKWSSKRKGRITVSGTLPSLVMSHRADDMFVFED